METITTYIEEKLKLKVNRLKSKESRPHESTFLGFLSSGKKVAGRYALHLNLLSELRRRFRKASDVRTRSGQRKDQENGGDNQRIGKLLFDRENQKSPLGTGQVHEVKISNGDMEQWKESKTKIRDLKKLEIKLQQVNE